MRPIGGFLGLEATDAGHGPYHRAPSLSTGRSCFRFILETIRPRRVHLPFYVCDALLNPAQRAGVAIAFYGLDRNLVPESAGEPARGDELYVVVNYFGLLGGVMDEVARLAPGRTVIDDSQAFFRRPGPSTWSFNSARKFFGVPDGAYLCGPAHPVPAELPAATPSAAHLTDRLSGNPRLAYRAFKRHEASLTDEPRGMSALTTQILAAVDYDAIAARRRANYRALDRLLGDRNLLRLTLQPGDVPLYYPFLAPRPLRDELIRRALFVPCLWPEVGARPGGAFSWERRLAADLCPLAVDQRYDDGNMAEIAGLVIGALDS